MKPEIFLFTINAMRVYRLQASDVPDDSEPSILCRHNNLNFSDIDSKNDGIEVDPIPSQAAPNAISPFRKQKQVRT
jgi:hypothetical protein